MFRSMPGLLVAVLAIAWAPAQGSQGQMLFEQTCRACHGQDAKGALPGVPDLTKPDGPLAQSDAVLKDHIIEGFQTPGSPMAMPAKGGNPALTPLQIEMILRYLRSLQH